MGGIAVIVVIHGNAVNTCDSSNRVHYIRDCLLHTYIKKKKTNVYIVPINRYFNSLLLYINVDPAGSEVKFDAQGDGLARYTIMNYRRLPNSASGYDYKV